MSVSAELQQPLTGMAPNTENHPFFWPWNSVISRYTPVCRKRRKKGLRPFKLLQLKSWLLPFLQPAVVSEGLAPAVRGEASVPEQSCAAHRAGIFITSVQGAAFPLTGADSILFPPFADKFWGKTKIYSIKTSWPARPPSSLTNKASSLHEASGKTERAIIFIYSCPRCLARLSQVWWRNRGGCALADWNGNNAQEEERMWGRQEHSFNSSIHIQAEGKYRSWMFQVCSPLVCVFYRLWIKVLIYITKPKARRHNLLALKWWCGQSRAGAGSWGLGGGWERRRLRDGGGRKTTPYISGDAGCRSVNGFLSWMNNCQKCGLRGRRRLYWPVAFHLLWSTVRTVAVEGWGGGDQSDRGRRESLFFNLRGGWDVDKVCN